MKAKSPQMTRQLQLQKRQLTERMEAHKAQIKPYEVNEELNKRTQDLNFQKQYFEKLKQDMQKDTNNFAYQNKIKNSIPESIKGDKVKEDLALGKARFNVEQEIFMKNGQKALDEFRKHMAVHDKDNTYQKMHTYNAVESEKRMGKTHTLDKLKEKHGQEVPHKNQIKGVESESARKLNEMMANRQTPNQMREAQKEAKKQENEKKMENSISPKPKLELER
jgi:hypothetical protein